MKVLALDSSAKSASVAIVEDGFIIGEFFINTSLTHSQTLVPMIDDLLKNTKWSLDEMDAFAVSAGPGSFTGIRIGISVIKGMAMALDKPCFGVSTLEALAYNLIGNNTIVSSCMDARRDQVYNAIFKVNNKRIERLTPDRALSIDELGEDLKKYGSNIKIVGDGADLCYNRLNSILPDLCVAPEILKYSKASSIALYALDNKNNSLSASELLPQYLRLPQAQRELKKRLNLNGGI